MKTDLIAGNAADVIAVTFGEWYQYSQSDVFVDLNTMPGADDVLAQHGEGTVKPFNVDGKQLGAPVGVGRRIPYINKDMFDKAGVPLPSQTVPMTIAQWTDAVKKIQATLDKNAIAANMFNSELLDGLVLSSGTSFISSDGKKVMINTPEGIKAIQGYKDFMSSGAQVPVDQI